MAIMAKKKKRRAFAMGTILLVSYLIDYDC